MNRIRPLRSGDTVAVVNPAGPLPTRFAKQYGYVTDFLEKRGYKVKDYGSHLETSSAERAASLLGAFVDPEVKAIFPICGGLGVYEIFEHLDYDLIGRNPKLFSGSSELSGLAVAIAQLGGFTTFHAPHIVFLHPKSSKAENAFTALSFWNMLTWDWHGKNRLDTHESHHCFFAPKSQDMAVLLPNIYSRHELIRTNKKHDVRYVPPKNKKRVSGKLLVGSLASIINTLSRGVPLSGTGRILVLDALDASHSQTIRDLKKLGGLIDLGDASGVCFASLSERSDRSESLYPELTDPSAISDFLSEADRHFGPNGPPVWYGFPSGHTFYRLTLPNESVVFLRPEDGAFELAECPFI